MAESTIARCSFCNRPRNEVKALISADEKNGPHICNRCLGQGWKAFEQEGKKEQAEKEKEAPLKKPVEIKKFLDEHVIGQDKAKTDVAIAIYNHYRRREAIRMGVEMGDVEIQKSNILLMGPSGCHRRGQLVLMFDGTLLAVEDVQVGDKLMGPDSTPRTVLELHRGTEEMVEIIPIKGEPWVVNGGHILTVYDYKTDALMDVALREWQAWAPSRCDNSKLVRAGGVAFPAQGDPLPLDPYFLGVLLGDGSLGPHVRGTSADAEIVAVIHEQATMRKLDVHSYGKEGTDAREYILSGTKGRQNPIAGVLDSLGLWPSRSENKFIPNRYKVASREDRLAILAGLCDTDGGYRDKALCYDYTTKSLRLAKDVAFVARSLGFAAYPHPIVKDGETYYQMNITGDVEDIPVKVNRKKARERLTKRDHLRTGFKTRELPPEEFFGFVLDGDHRYLLDDFTVTHNTGKTELARTIAKMLNVPFHVGDATRLTQAGYVGDDIESLVQGLIANASGDLERAQWGIIFIDEFDKLARKSGRSGTGFRDVGGEGVQQSILKMLEGSAMSIPRGVGMRVGQGGQADDFDTSNVLFICAGSFAGIEDVISHRVNKTAHLGFGSVDRQKLSKTDTYLAVTEEDVLEFGMIPELMGRLPVLTTCIDLTEDEMVRILTEPKNAIIKQFVQLFKLDGIDLQLDEAALRAIGRDALKRPTGARALRSIVENVLRPYSFESRSQDNIKAIRITEDVVNKKGDAIMVLRDKKAKPAVAQG
jgi:endopeptidase Clp ATP-binding regulatory subunit ClpX